MTCCKDCVPPKRYPGCHDKCPEYLKEKQEWNARKERVRSEKNRDVLIDGYVVNRSLKSKKRHKKG